VTIKLIKAYLTRFFKQLDIKMNGTIVIRGFPIHFKGAKKLPT